MRIAAIKTNDIDNGPGIRVSLWTQGCPHHCEGCWNPETWDFNSGREFDDKDYNTIIKEVKKGQNFSILGGEPLLQKNLGELSILLSSLRLMNKNLNVWLWTGYEFEDIKDLEILSKIDVVITGKFIKDKKEKHPYHGSSNQKVIDVRKSLAENMVIEYKEN